ncbi:hypothetical protein HJ01_01115 [Flavobacterium frigoris PS1]|uniref:Uncharacterized protein n=1 Tax=Flavobacterium frigoris (strain PS1) TaxID=1086011 RepID=H7FPL7_FLAFP|nr:hypothetical protein HJ01_01115 [Flavobacterium frigoris PS1]
MFLFSPDCSENPFYFFFKNKKIATQSGRDDGKKAPIIRSKKNIDMLSRKGLRNTVEVFLCYLS